MIASVLSLLLACEGPVKPTAPPPAPAPAPAPAPVAEAPAPAPLPPDTTRLARTVEVHAAGSYTILKMDACGAEAWVAGPKTDGLTVGQVLEMPLGTAVANFESKELKRTFDELLLVEWLKPTDQEPRCPPRHDQHQQDPKAPSDVTGVVKETMESGGYRYALLDVCGTDTWVAGPKVPVKVGETLLGDLSAEMTDFTSTTLGRRFDKILFLKRIAIGPKPPDCPPRK